MLEVRAAAGGRESQIFALELFNMYKLFAQQQRMRFEELSTSFSEPGALREGVAIISGQGMG